MKLFWRDEVKRKPIETLKQQLRNKLGGYCKDIHSVETATFFRGVIWNERPDKVKCLSYPPADKVRTLGRLNREHQSMFYASCGAPAVYYEIHAKVGHKIAVSTWELTETVWMHNLGFHQKSLERIGGILEWSRGRFANPIPNESEFNAKLRRQLSEAFTEDVPDGEERRYKLPIVINELLYDQSEPLPTRFSDGLRFERPIGTIYPALRMHGAADNVAIWPEYADRFLRLKHVSYILVEAADPQSHSYTITSLAQADQFDGDTIIWRTGIEEERHRRGHISYENGRWILRDGFGKIYDIH